MDSVGDGEPQGVVRAVARQREMSHLKGMSQLLTVWKHSPTVARIFSFIKKREIRIFVRNFLISEYW